MTVLRCWSLSPIIRILLTLMQRSDGSRTGELVCWGRNDYGQVSVSSALGRVVDVAAGADFVCVINASHRLECWGRNQHGPIDIPLALGPVDAVFAGGQTICAVERPSHALRCWGDNREGQANPPHDLGPVKIHSQAVAIGDASTCAINAQNFLVCWGSRGTVPPEAQNIAFQSVTSGSWHTCGLPLSSPDPAPVCWGGDDYCRSSCPEQMNVSAICAGAHFTCIVRSQDGVVHCWGGPVPRVNSPHLLVAGPNHVCAVNSSNDMICSGNTNRDGQLSIPQHIGNRFTRGDIFQLALGNGFNCLLVGDNEPTPQPTLSPSTGAPSKAPTARPTASQPTPQPTLSPSTDAPSEAPTARPTTSPSLTSTSQPTFVPTTVLSPNPTVSPSLSPTSPPMLVLTTTPAGSPTASDPAKFSPTFDPTEEPTTAASPTTTLNSSDKNSGSSAGMYTGIAAALLTAGVGLLVWRVRRNRQTAQLDQARPPLDEGGYVAHVSHNSAYELRQRDYAEIDPNYEHNCIVSSRRDPDSQEYDVAVTMRHSRTRHAQPEPQKQAVAGTSYSRLAPDHFVYDVFGVATTPSTRCSYIRPDGRNCKCRRIDGSNQCVQHTCQIDGCFKAKSSRASFCVIHSNRDVYGN